MSSGGLRKTVSAYYVSVSMYYMRYSYCSCLHPGQGAGCMLLTFILMMIGCISRTTSRGVYSMLFLLPIMLFFYAQRHSLLCFCKVPITYYAFLFEHNTFKMIVSVAATDWCIAMSSRGCLCCIGSLTHISN